MRDDRSFIELKARQRAQTLLDDGSYRELLDPFEGITSPWLGAQGIVPQADDGMVVAKGTINGQPAVVVAIEGAFQGGSMGEVSGAKMAAALELAAEDNRNGIPTQAVLCLETGGVRLQEANLGLAAIADIHAAIVDLRRYTPVVGIVAGTVGCFGGMSIAAALCSCNCSSSRYPGVAPGTCELSKMMRQLPISTTGSSRRVCTVASRMCANRS